METIKFTDITPATYNPRKISDEAFTELQGSLKTLGFILPIIINKENWTIVAGHQRTKAAKAIGLEEAPAYLISSVEVQDEILFNQVHNAVEYEPEENGRYVADIPFGFNEQIDSALFTINSINASCLKDISLLLNKYGNPMCAIICDGEVVFGNNYIRACQLLSKTVNLYHLEPSKKELFRYYFGKSYGFYCYDHIERNDFIQGYAQMTNKFLKNSIIYNLALPFIEATGDKAVKILDFGCGKGFSVKEMRERLGFKNIIGLEFFNHNKKGISVEKGNEMIDKLIKFVERNGLFDFVICDSVLNSVNSQEAENCVIATLILFCKPGGMIFFCGRTADSIESLKNRKTNANCKAFEHTYLDDNGLVGHMRNGNWYFQKFHTKEDVDNIIERFGLSVVARKSSRNMWDIGAIKGSELPDKLYMEAIDFEFNMVLPGRKRYNRHNDIRRLFGYPEAEVTSETEK